MRETLPAGRTVGRVLRSFHPVSVPKLARRNYRPELAASFFLPLMLGAAEGSMVSVLIKLAFADVAPQSRLNLIVALLAASPSFGNITSFVWVRLSHGLDKVRFATGLQVGAAACVGVMAVAPRSEAGLYLIALSVVLVRMFWAGFVTMRSTIWRANYARGARARITGRILMVQVLLVAALGIVLGLLMGDKLAAVSPRLSLRAAGVDPLWAFRGVVLASCVLSLIGVWQYAQIRMRGRAHLLRQERDSAVNGGDSPSFNPVAMVRVLRDDGRFAAYMGCQMLLGLGNLMIMPLIPIVLTDRFGVGYFQGILVAGSIPFMMMPIVIPFWARFLDRVHVVRYRARHSWVFVAAIACLVLSTRLDLLWLMYAAAVIRGCAFGGGVLAWNLGHLDFAPRERSSQYMSVHVTLTGVRGLLTPFVGVWIYQAFEAYSPGSGWWAFALCLVLAAIGALGFVVFARAMGREERRRTEPVEPAPPSRVGGG